jgi:pectinesterase
MKKISSLITILLFVFTFYSYPFANEKANIIVAKDGSGDYTSVQEAINSVSIDNKQNIIILIRKGIYNEKIYISKSFVTLVGEDRDSTKIIYAELRKN